MRLFTLFGSILLLLLLPIGSFASAEITVSRHQQTASGLQGWLLEDQKIEIQLNPLKQDQVRAFYLARGFSSDVVEQIAASCVFQAVMSNISEPAVEVSVDLSDWRLLENTREARLTSKDQWLQSWAEQGASDAARVAFRWATFPWMQSMQQTGDYGWGMILLGDGRQPTLSQSSFNQSTFNQSSFDIVVRWRVQGELFSQTLQGLSCPG